MKESNKDVNIAARRLAVALNRCAIKEEASTEVAIAAFAVVAVGVLTAVGDDKLTSEFAEFVKSEYARLRNNG